MIVARTLVGDHSYKILQFFFVVVDLGINAPFLVTHSYKILQFLFVVVDLGINAPFLVTHCSLSNSEDAIQIACSVLSRICDFADSL